jgi:hypothetical protein
MHAKYIYKTAIIYYELYKKYDEYFSIKQKYYDNYEDCQEKFLDEALYNFKKISDYKKSKAMIVRIKMDKKNSVNFNYNKFVGYYDVYSDLPYPNLEIRKDKKGNYYLFDYGKIGESIFAKDNTIYLQKLKKNNCKLYSNFG